MNKKLCIFSSSSNAVPEIYFKNANEIARLFAEAGYELIFGGGNIGLMGETARVFKKYQVKITAVIPKKLNLKNVIYPEADEIIVTETMNERKLIMENNSDAFISLAGGFGTLEEILEIITLKQLGYFDKPIAFLNTNGFYNHLLNQFEVCYQEKFINNSNRNLYFVSDCAYEIFEYVHHYSSKIPINLEDKFKIGFSQ